MNIEPPPHSGTLVLENSIDVLDLYFASAVSQMVTDAKQLDCRENSPDARNADTIKVLDWAIWKHGSVKRSILW